MSLLGKGCNTWLSETHRITAGRDPILGNVYRLYLRDGGEYLGRFKTASEARQASELQPN